MRNQNALKPLRLSVRRDHRIARPQNPFFNEEGPPTPVSSSMEFTGETDMIFSGGVTIMEYSQ